MHFNSTYYTFQRTRPLISKEELTGIIDALGALREDEICAIAAEISFLRNEDFSSELVLQMCEEAVHELLLETVGPTEVKDAVSDVNVEGSFYIPGPNAFPDIPFELSEVIDILRLSKREVDMGGLTQRFTSKLHDMSSKLSKDIEEVSMASRSEAILTLTERYSEILNIYYDYDSWLPEGIDGIEEELQEISKRLEHLRVAQDI